MTINGDEGDAREEERLATCMLSASTAHTGLFYWLVNEVVTRKRFSVVGERSISVRLKDIRDHCVCIYISLRI